MILGVRALGAAVHVGARDVVHLDEACLAASFDRHVGDGKALVHRQAADGAARELHRLVQRAVDADHADDVEDDVLAGNARVELAVDLEEQRLGHLEPRLAGGIADRGIGGADARGECAERTIGAGVGVGADDEVARAHNALLRQKRMLDTHAADFVIVRDALLAGEFAHLLGLLGALDVLVGNVMVGHQGDLGRVEHLLDADLLEVLDRDGRRDVVGKHEVEIAFDQLPRLHFIEMRMSGQNLFRHGHGTCHVDSLFRAVEPSVKPAHCSTPARSRSSSARKMQIVTRRESAGREGEGTHGKAHERQENSSPRKTCAEARRANKPLVIYSVDTCWRLAGRREEDSPPPRCSPHCTGG